jgi:predicted CXXCH cytochrome family protein
MLRVRMPRLPPLAARLAVPLACLGAAPLLVALALLVGHDPRRAEAALPLHARDQDYVGASACRTCHPDKFASWRRTYHSTMTQLPSATAVLGRFDGAPVTLFGATATPVERDGRFFMRLPATAGEAEREAEVALCVGSRRYQQYFERTEGPEGINYRRLPLLWHVGEARWMHLNAVFLEADSDDWGAHRAVWNANCIFCHNTGVVPGLRARGGGGEGEKTVDSHVADLGIACEACHGPGRDHVARGASLVGRYRDHLGLGGGPARDIVDPLRLPQAEGAALCGQCHAQRLPDPMEKLWTFLDTGPTFRPGGRLEGHVAPIRRDTPSADPHDPNAFRDRFWGDGTARLTAYEYLGTTQSPCFAGGRFECRTCHTMHGGDAAGQIEPEMRGDRACTQCHAAIARDVSAHTHHPAASSGSRCLECHMPRMVYGVLELHRSHRVESPDVARDVEAGRPNACTACHLDRTAGWAAERMRAFWGPRHGDPRARPDGAPLDVPEALASLHAGDPVQRAVYVAALGRADSAVAPGARGFLLANALVGLGDGYGAIRTLARRSALDLDRTLGLGLGGALRDYDPEAPRARRDPALEALVRRLADAAAGARLPPPPPGALVGPGWQLDVAAIRALLGLQSRQEISIGE